MTEDSKTGELIFNREAYQEECGGYLMRGNSGTIVEGSRHSDGGGYGAGIVKLNN